MKIKKKIIENEKYTENLQSQNIENSEIMTNLQNES